MRLDKTHDHSGKNFTQSFYPHAITKAEKQGYQTYGPTTVCKVLNKLTKSCPHAENSIGRNFNDLLQNFDDE